MKILITGGAGFIGGITSKLLIEKGHDIIIYDSLIKGNKETIDFLKCDFIEGCLSNKELLNQTFKKFKPEAVIHFAGFIEAGESMKDPSKFFQNNVFYGLNLLDVMVQNNVKKIIFSSSAGIYKTSNNFLKETNSKEPSNVYGETKLMFEEILKWYDKIYGVKYISLRYFNAFGNMGKLGEKHKPETHLIPLVINAAFGKKESINVFGTDYNTSDGTCIRDYIHVKDLAQAHILALNNFEKNSKEYNVGTGKGISVKEIINFVKEITGKNIKVIEEKRRLGDPPILVADSFKIRDELGWDPEIDFKQGLKETIEYFKREIYS